ncbi:DUF2267 domain-containing protein [Fulvivirgaceae bacterium PWU4]|uniref:DUF2267 domain-containing protein n=1 Tax=Chryseosolibacter histidini TaxID=2782349 RepID=A0AAP2DPF4_9BACT|nr:DUF2267 domain-containing protein [Chryseosolibacter histidini]MBT1698792.1 DUF2267 domain-containing protein [Chryseosolibacter histidini]
MAIRVEEYVLKGNEFIRHVARELNDAENTDHASRVIVSVLHTLRDILSPGESLHLISQLPLYIKAAYVDGWKPGIAQMQPGSMADLLDQLRSQDEHIAERYLISDDTAKQEVQAVIRVLKKYLSEGEARNIIARLPSLN